MNFSITLNGKVRRVDIKGRTSIAELLKKISVSREVALVKKNGKIVPEGELIGKNDKIEVFQVVYGG